jgi:hypothetical protein
MASVRSVGGNPGIDERGLVELLNTGMLTAQRDRENANNKKNSNDDIIKTGIASKVMRPAKDGEKSDFTDSQGRGWVYDDASVKEENRQRDEARKTQAWDTINSRAAAMAQQAANNGQDYWSTYNRALATMVGHPDGKMSDTELSALSDQYGPAAQNYFNSFQKDADKAPTRQTVQGPQPSLMNSLLNVVPGIGKMGSMPPAQQPSLTSMMGLPSWPPPFPGPQQGGQSQQPQGGFDPMAILQHVLSQTAPMQIMNGLQPQQQNAQQ